MKYLAIIATILQTVVFLCVVVATPIDVFHSAKKFKDGEDEYYVCYSLWGEKRCGNHKTNPNDEEYRGFPCKHVRNTMNAAAAFAIVSIFLTLIVLVLCVFLICKPIIGGGRIPAIVGIIAFCTILVSWACILGAYYYGECTFIFAIFVFKVPKISAIYNLYAGFGLLVTGCILQLINAIILFFA